MMRLPTVLFLACVSVLAASSSSRAKILSVVESNLGADAPAIIVNGGFAEDAKNLADRNHEHNGVTFASVAPFQAPFPNSQGDFGLGPILTVPLPSYLLGGDYVRFANDARDNVGYSAVVTANGPKDWYLLIDNRVDGPNAAPKPFPGYTTDPILGGTLQWVIDGSWQRVNTGISPYGLADYTGVDEDASCCGGLGIGPGVSIDSIYAVYTLKKQTSVTVGNNGTGGTNMISLIAVPEPASLTLLAGRALGLAMIRCVSRRR
jgi:hypothetical protein